MRCDSKILEIGLFVASLDYHRIKKPIRANDNRVGGTVALLRFTDQVEEAKGIAGLCHYLVEQRSLKPSEILILLRSDQKGAFSSVLREHLGAVKICVVTADTNPFDQDSGRMVLAILRIMRNVNDHLAWRTLIKLRRNNHLGTAAVSELYQVSKDRGMGFANVVQAITADPSQFSLKSAQRIRAEGESILELDKAH